MAKLVLKKKPKVKLVQGGRAVPPTRKVQLLNQAVVQVQTADTPNPETWMDTFKCDDLAQARDTMHRLMGAGGSLRYRVITVHEEA